jgi:hypothetical protein
MSSKLLPKCFFQVNGTINLMMLWWCMMEHLTSMGVAEPSKMDSEPHIWHDVGTLTNLTVALVDFFLWHLVDFELLSSLFSLQPSTVQSLFLPFSLSLGWSCLARGRESRKIIERGSEGHGQWKGSPSRAHCTRNTGSFARRPCPCLPSDQALESAPRDTPRRAQPMHTCVVSCDPPCPDRESSQPKRAGQASERNEDVHATTSPKRPVLFTY